jgi:alcohol dehydrogenase (cytochrome c)
MLRRFTRSAGIAAIALGLVSTLVVTPSKAQDQWPSADTFANAATQTSNWILPAHDYSGNRYVAKSEITPANVKTLKPAWVFKFADGGEVEAAPIVWNGTMYVTSSHNDVFALNAKTGAQKWHFAYHPHVIAFAANRGIALAGGKVFVATLDGHLIALDAVTGKVVWNVVGVHDTTNTFYSMAPVPYKNMLLEGASNGDWGGIGYVTAFDQSTGKRVWDWKTVPGPGEAGHETWSGDSWKRGGATVWSGLAIDAASETLYVSTGNPQPDFLGTTRKGSNLYSDSMVALDISGGAPKMKWYHQFIPHDTHDWDPAMPPVLFHATVGGASRSLVAAGDKAGNFWVLDAETGKLVHHAVVSTQKGQNTEPSRSGDIACPNTNGGVEFNGGSFMPETNAFYVPSVDQCGLWKSPGRATYIAGQFYLGGSFPTLVGPSTGWMSAIDMDTGKFVWRKHLSLPDVGGALSLGSGVVFNGSISGDFTAYDAKSGAVLWHYNLGTAIQGPPSSYMLGGKQYIVTGGGPAGVGFASFSKTNGGDEIIAFTTP